MTLSRQGILAQILQERVVGIVRLKEQNQVAECLACLIEGGMRCLEITSNTPGYVEEIAKARARFPDILIGAGTITNAEKAHLAVEAGAQFLVTPNINEDVVKLAHEADIPVLMGALTPTEINLAVEWGADIVKLFPAGDIGIGYCKGIMGPFNDIPLMAVGGVSKENVVEWLQAGIAGVGIGSQLCRAVSNEEDKREHTEYVKGFMRLVKQSTQH
ncbi:bifunctional 4-hydroxy-2-oxoglutarate aldolase/2-dehydro-3-deoxy-phosphogluconate aldolase [Agaribacter flavus]|uniref:Bifunctional 4-hydroxy-2-oxoglutarate aldolase/2-dehydro-3-deoxy-phosphogluconate aldolase n=1 Tax=Agaribacter flavus TaxID=1902781 RepID=A0ABV7FKN2_9ALTE